jgi:RNA polymerase sigma-70 factor (ECF subfamily)
MQKPASAAAAGQPLAAEPTDRQLLDRFVQNRDGAAFEILVRRHGPMVLGVCRRVLTTVQDAEDAFQATFLVLARKAHSLDKPDLLANWLYGVAVRTARKAKARAARRSLLERQAFNMAAANTQPEAPTGEEFQSLDEELQRLPDKYRLPLVLCYLEGLTNEQAARRLGWPSGSISYRLARGRELLRRRLSRQQRLLPAMMFPALLAQTMTPEDVPGRLVLATVQAAVEEADDAGRRPLQRPPSISAAVSELAEEILATLSKPRRPRLSLTLALIALIGLAGAVLVLAPVLGKTFSPQPPAAPSGQGSPTGSPSGQGSPTGSPSGQGSPTGSCH